jgi:hypothetical protein
MSHLPFPNVFFCYLGRSILAPHSSLNSVHIRDSPIFLNIRLFFLPLQAINGPLTQRESTY